MPLLQSQRTKGGVNTRRKAPAFHTRPYAMPSFYSTVSLGEGRKGFNCETHTFALVPLPCGLNVIPQPYQPLGGRLTDLSVWI